MEESLSSDPMQQRKIRLERELKRTESQLDKLLDAYCSLSQGANYPETGLTSGTSSGTTFDLGPRAKGTTLIELSSPNSGPKITRSAEPRVETAFRHSLIAVRYDSQRLSTRREFNGR
jgi:hypothetical protein